MNAQNRGKFSLGEAQPFAQAAQFGQVESRSAAFFMFHGNIGVALVKLGIGVWEIFHNSTWREELAEK